MSATCYLLVWITQNHYGGLKVDRASFHNEPPGQITHDMLNDMPAVVMHFEAADYGLAAEALVFNVRKELRMLKERGVRSVRREILQMALNDHERHLQ